MIAVIVAGFVHEVRAWRQLDDEFDERDREGPWFESAETVVNESTEDVVFVVEPWAREYPLAPRAAYVVRARSRKPGALEIEREGNWIRCHAWEGSTVEVWSGDRLVDSL